MTAGTAIQLSNRRLALVVSALGLAQIISWGSLYYAIAVLGESIRQDLKVSSNMVFGAFTFSLLVSGLVAPRIGKLIDQRGGRQVLCGGSLLACIALAVAASAQGVGSLLLGSFLCGAAMAVCLYEAAFITLNQIAGERYRHAVTALTLYGGLASTAFWPLSQWLLDLVGWRYALLSYAALQLLLCFPLHAIFLPAGKPQEMHVAVTREQQDATSQVKTYRWLAVAFCVGSFVLSALSVHMIGLLKQAGLTPGQAVLVATLIGPMQVLVRLLEFVFARRAGPVLVGGVSFVLMVSATLCLYSVQGYSLLAFLVAVLYGFANGIFTIVRGTVPAVLFGRQGYGALLGRLARPAFIARALAPFAFSAFLTLGLVSGQAILALSACSVLAGLAYLRTTRLARLKA